MCSLVAILTTAIIHHRSNNKYNNNCNYNTDNIPGSNDSDDSKGMVKVIIHNNDKS